MSQERTRARRLAGALVASTLLTTACGLQQAGLDGSVSVAQGSGIPGAGVPTSGPNGPADGTTGVVTPGQPGTTGGTTGVIGGTTGGSTGTTGGSTGGASTGASAGGSVTPGLKGEVTFSYVNVTGFDRLGQIVVVRTASTGDAQAQTRALAAYVNANGGIAGRKLVTKVHDYNAQQASEVNDNNLCARIADTDKATLAVLHGQIHASARGCYKAKKVLAFEGAAYGFGHSFYMQHSPYQWSPSYADYDQASKALVATVKQQQWLKGETKAGVILWDDAAYHEVADKTLVPLLKQLGVDVVKAAISNSDIGAIENGIHAAAQTMVVNQVDHLLFLGSAPLQPFFVQQNQQYEQFRYALNSFDVPRYMAKNFARNMVGSIGIGFSPVDDVLDAQHKFPQPGLETECVRIYKQAGVAVPARYSDEFNSKQAMSYCESTLLYKKVADSLGRIPTPAEWTAKAEQLGTSFQAAQTFQTSYGPGKHTGAAVYRELKFDNGACKCMVYTTGLKPLP